MTVATPSLAHLVNDFTELLNKGSYAEAIERFYDDNITSIESIGTEDFPKVITGKDNVKAKFKRWMDAHEIHKATLSAPMVGDGQFSMHYQWDVTLKAANQRYVMEEMALYYVEAGKIVKEHFFYNKDCD